MIVGIKHVFTKSFVFNLSQPEIPLMFLKLICRNTTPLLLLFSSGMWHTDSIHLCFLHPLAFPFHFSLQNMGKSTTPEKWIPTLPSHRALNRAALSTCTEPHHFLRPPPPFTSAAWFPQGVWPCKDPASVSRQVTTHFNSNTKRPFLL